MRLLRSFFSNLGDLVRRERPFTRREQLGLVLLCHAGILLGTVAIVAGFQLSSTPNPPLLFLLGEVVIIAIALPFIVNFSDRRDDDTLTLSQALAERKEMTPEEAERKREVEALAGRVLIGASILQFIALASLLWETGGPIESPFAEMTLIVAVFTPYIANKPTTIGIVVGISILFYAALIYAYTCKYPTPHTMEEFRMALQASSPAVSEPPPWSYFAVNILILIGGIAFTVFEAVFRSKEMAALRATVGGTEAMSNGESEEETDFRKVAEGEDNGAGLGDKPTGDDLDEDATRA